MGISMKKTILAIDSTTNYIFSRALGDADLDFQKVWNYFNPDNDKVDFSAHYFLQMRDSFEDVKYFNFINRIRSFGWQVDMGINGAPVKTKYAGVIEYGSCYARMLQVLERYDNQIKYTNVPKDDVDIELVLMANHLSYAKLLKEVKTQYPYVYRTLVCDVNGAPDQLMMWADDLVDVRNMDFAKTKPVEDAEEEAV
jgi:hypothetical protein